MVGATKLVECGMWTADRGPFLLPAAGGRGRARADRGAGGRDVCARLVLETEQLLERGLAGNRTAMQAIGYRQVVEHLRGERSLEETIGLIKQRTRQFAKRQMTWFRRQFKAQWRTVEPEAGAEEVADLLLKP